VCQDGQRDLPAERPLGGFERPTTPEKTPRAVIVEPHPAVRAVLEYLLAREGYAVEARGDIAAGEVRPAGEDGSVAKFTHTGFRLAGAAIAEGEAGRAVRMLRGLALPPAFLRRFRKTSSGPERELLGHVPLLARLPAVVCGIGGPRECIRPGVSGFVANPGDEEGFFSRIEFSLDDAVAREKMGQVAREFAEGMSWEAVLDGLIELHSRLACVRPDPDVYARSQGGSG
jgi:hypothetical protein